MNQLPAREEQVFADALALAPDERVQFLDRTCSGDAELRARVDALLAAHEASVSLSRSPLAPGFAALAGEQPGAVIDRYKLRQKLGEGGCGVVWMAEQEEPVRRRVALKVIKAGMDTREVIARFSAERQALAIMDHPGIAKVLDAGATAAGRPYFVMELVKGVPITRFSDEQNLTIRARLELFTRVCEAVQHAHHKGIIHRDLKPSNILVALHGSVPLPTVIDFGIAKAIQGRLTDATLFTGYDQIIGTPAYMSPEQADTSGLDIDTRSDVYSLGVVLYELLAGRCPFEPGSLATPNREEMRRLIREVEPPRPSTRFSTLSGADRATVARRRGIDPARLPLLLSGDLDWIVMKALEKNRSRRYDSPAALAADIARHLQNEPVLARPPSGSYRCRKFVRRHRYGVASAAAVAVSLLAGTAVSTALAVRATRAERATGAALRRVADERAHADDLLTFMVEDLKTPLARVGELGVLERVIDKALSYFASRDPRELDDSARLREVRVLNQLGGVRLDQLRTNDAERTYREAYDRAAAIVTRNPKNTLALWARGEAEWGIGFVHYRRTEVEPAREWFRREHLTRTALVALEPDDLRWQRKLATQPHDLAVLEMDHGDKERARALFREELGMVTKLLLRAPGDLELQRTIANVTSFLGSLAEAAADFEEAAQRFAQQTAQLEAIERMEPKDPHWRYKRADSILFQAGVSAITGRRREAEAFVIGARELLLPLVTQDPTNHRWHRALLAAELRQAQLLQADGRAAAALELTLKSRRELEGMVAKQPSDTWAPARLAATLRLEAELEHAMGAANARGTAARAIDVADRIVGRRDSTQINRAERAAGGIIAGHIAAAQRDFTAANEHWKRARAILGAIEPTCKDWRVLDPAVRLSRLLGRKDEAAAHIAPLETSGYVPLQPWPPAAISPSTQ